MLDLDFEIAEIRKKLDLSSSDLAQVVSSLNKEVAAHVQAAITEGAVKIQKAIASNLERDHMLRIRLSGLEVAASASSDQQLSTPPAVPRGTISRIEYAHEASSRKSAADLILERLANSRNPVPTGDLDSIVIGGGLTKASADKAKYLLKKNGYATAVKRRWSITDVGRKMLNGLHASP